MFVFVCLNKVLFWMSVTLSDLRMKIQTVFLWTLRSAHLRCVQLDSALLLQGDCWPISAVVLSPTLSGFHGSAVLWKHGSVRRQRVRLVLRRTRHRPTLLASCEENSKLSQRFDRIHQSCSTEPVFFLGGF